MGKDGEDERHGFLGARVLSGLKLGLGYQWCWEGQQGRGDRRGAEAGAGAGTWPC